MLRRLDILSDRFEPEAELRVFREGVEGAGAIVSFTGLVRDAAGAAEVSGLHLQHYPGYTEHEIEAIIADASARWPLQGLLVLHRVGDLAPEEPIVLVAAASAHRRAAFEAADFLMDYLKSEAPFWKKERRSDGDRWIEPRQQDYADKARWAP